MKAFIVGSSLALTFALSGCTSMGSLASNQASTDCETACCPEQPVCCPDMN